MKKVLSGIISDYRKLNSLTKYSLLLVFAGFTFICYGLYVEILLVTKGYIVFGPAIIMLLSLSLALYSSIRYTIEYNRIPEPKGKKKRRKAKITEFKNVKNKKPVLIKSHS